MAVSNSSYYSPDDAIQELLVQEQVLNTAIDIQALLRILVAKGIITKQELDDSRAEVRSGKKYKATIEIIEAQKNGFMAAKEDPQAYLKAIFKAKMDGKIK